MIMSFKCNRTEHLYRSGKTRLWPDILNVIERKLTMLDAASVLTDLGSPPATAWSLSAEHAKANTAFVSTDNGESALSGVKKALKL